MKRRAILLLAPLTLLFSVACGGQDTEKLDVAGAFSIELPAEMVALETIGFDSVAGEFASAEMKLSYDFGMNAASPMSGGAESSKQSLLSIDGREATIHYYEDRNGTTQYPFVAALHVPNAPEGKRLTMFLRCAEDDCTDEARKIFRSLSWAEGTGEAPAQVSGSTGSRSSNPVEADGDAAQ
jgi:hypothetical protein